VKLVWNMNVAGFLFLIPTVALLSVSLKWSASQNTDTI